MILTGQAKKDFDYWLQERNCNLYDMIRHNNVDTVVVNSYIIEWLDSVGIYLTIGRCGYILNNNEISITIKSGNTRHEATEQAIKHANKIYNEQNK